MNINRPKWDHGSAAAPALRLALEGMDAFRRLGGLWMDAWGMAPEPAPHSSLATGSPARLRRYDGGISKAAPAALLVPAPIKTADIWDLAPGSSVVRNYLAAGFRVYLVDWPQTQWDAPENMGLAGYASGLLGACARAAIADAGVGRLHLAGHSLGGTLAALACCLDTEQYETLTLVGAPLDFRAGAGALGRWLDAEAVAAELPPGDLVPGSALSLAAFAAAPDAFWEGRAADVLAASADPARLRLHWQAERWLMAERALPRQLLLDVIEALWGANGFARGTLHLAGRTIGPGDLQVPTAVLTNEHCAVAPSAAVLPVLERAGTGKRRVFWYEEEAGTAIQHLTPLIGPAVNAALWPQILSWLQACAGSEAVHIPGPGPHTGAQDHQSG